MKRVRASSRTGQLKRGAGRVMANQRRPFEGMRELALFAGAGGGILGGHLLGWRTVCAVERDAYAASILAQRQNDGLLLPFPIWSDVCSFDGRPWRGVADVVSGGFPCQDISVAGCGAGLAGKRSGLWSEFARIIGEVRPDFAFIENSPMLVTRGLDRVLCDLAALGFDAEWGVLSAADLGAPHERERLWIVAHANGKRDAMRGDGTDDAEAMASREFLAGRCVSDSGAGCAEGAGESSGVVSDSNRNSIQRMVAKPQPSGHKRPTGLHDRARGEQRWPEWPTEPGVGRVVDGMAYRMDRVKAIGNGQVPRVAAAAFTTLRERAGW